MSGRNLPDESSLRSSGSWLPQMYHSGAVPTQTGSFAHPTAGASVLAQPTLGELQNLCIQDALLHQILAARSGGNDQLDYAFRGVGIGAATHGGVDRTQQAVAHQAAQAMASAQMQAARAQAQAAAEFQAAAQVRAAVAAQAQATAQIEAALLRENRHRAAAAQLAGPQNNLNIDLLSSFVNGDPRAAAIFASLGVHSMSPFSGLNSGGGVSRTGLRAYEELLMNAAASGQQQLSPADPSRLQQQLQAAAAAAVANRSSEPGPFKTAMDSNVLARGGSGLVDQSSLFQDAQRMLCPGNSDAAAMGNMLGRHGSLNTNLERQMSYQGFGAFNQGVDAHNVPPPQKLSVEVATAPLKPNNPDSVASAAATSPAAVAFTVSSSSANEGTGDSVPQSVTGYLSGYDSDDSSASLPAKPVRPLSAYNLFFRHERAKMLGEEPPPPPSQVPIGSKPKKRVRRPHRKTHGKVGFISLARTMAKNWAECDRPKRRYFEGLAAEEMIKYKKAKKDHKTLMDRIQARKDQKLKAKEEQDTKLPVVGSH